MLTILGIGGPIIDERGLLCDSAFMAALSASLIEFTIDALDARLRELGQDRDRIDKQIAETTDAIRQWRLALRNLDSGSVVRDGDPRKKRGENPLVIRQWFLDHPTQSFTIPEIVKGTGLQNGSVHNVLKKDNSEYEQDLSGKWKLRIPVNGELKNGTAVSE